MFHLFFGIIWTAISVFIAFIMYNTNGTVEVNGRPVSHEEFNAMLWPKIFIGIFICIGIVFIIVGLKKIITNILTRTIGTETYGLITNVYPSNVTVNGRPQLMADVLVVVNDRINRYSETIGFDWNKYRIGDFVLIKIYKKDINIVRLVNRNEVPYEIIPLLENDNHIQEVYARDNEYDNYNRTNYNPSRYKNESDW